MFKNKSAARKSKKVRCAPPPLHPSDVKCLQNSGIWLLLIGNVYCRISLRNKICEKELHLETWVVIEYAFE